MDTAQTELRQTCRVCKQTKGIQEYGFHIRSKKHKTECKECARNAAIQYRIQNKEKYLITQANSKLKQTYGFSLEKYEEQLKKQDGKCAICKTGSPLEGHIKRFAVDHCHSTGKVRGLLCSKCNKGIGFFNDSTELLAQAIQYLQEAG
jgi:ribosomal protein S27AE